MSLTFTAFNRWLDDDWGFAYRDRIFAAPYLSLAEVDWAVRELEWALDRGARVVCLRPAAPTTVLGQRPPTDPMFDPFWARASEAGVTVVVHAGDSGYSSQGYAPDGFAATFGGAWRPTLKLFNIERAAYDFLITLAFDTIFDRFPNLRVASVENGSEFLSDLFRKLRSTSRKMPGYFATDAAVPSRQRARAQHATPHLTHPASVKKGPEAETGAAPTLTPPLTPAPRGWRTARKPRPAAPTLTCPRRGSGRAPESWNGDGRRYRAAA